MKKIQKQQKAPTNKALEIAMEKYPIGFVFLITLPKDKILLSVIKKQHFFYKKNYIFKYSAPIFHPPQLT